MQKQRRLVRRTGTVGHSTMRPFQIGIATLFAFCSSAQTGQLQIFKKSEYINGNFYRQVSDTINCINEPVDIYFFKRHFLLPYYLPEKLIDERHKNEKLSVWRKANGKKDYQENWENTYAYDSAGRVTGYTYSGCLICSNFPYRYTVTYNSKGQVERIFNTINLKDDFKFYYNAKGDVVKLEKYLLDKMETAIEYVN